MSLNNVTCTFRVEKQYARHIHLLIGAPPSPEIAMTTTISRRRELLPGQRERTRSINGQVIRISQKTNSKGQS